MILGAALLGAVSAPGCGRIGFDPLVTAGDDADPAVGSPDGGLVDVALPADAEQGGYGGGFDQSIAGTGGVDGRVSPSDAEVIDAPVPVSVDGGVGTNDAQVTDTSPDPGMDGMSGGGGAFVSGQYLGTGTAGLKVSGLGFAPDVLFVHPRVSSSSLFATRLMPSGRARVLSDFNAITTTDIVTGFDADGFELGTKWANVSGVVGDYLALKATPGAVAVGRFAGDGQPRNLTGLGFAPGYVFVACDGRPPMHRSRTMHITIQLRGQAGGNRITSLDGDGFSLGSDADVNQPSSDCQWFAVRGGKDAVATTVFIRNSTARRLVTLPGGLPQAVFIQCEAVTGQQWVWKPLSSGADVDASYTLGNSGPQINLVQRLLPGGFELGSDARVNGGGLSCHAVAFGG